MPPPKKRGRVDKNARSAAGAKSATSTPKTILERTPSTSARTCPPKVQFALMRNADAPITLHPLSQLNKYVDDATGKRMRALEARLQGQLHTKYIPACLRTALQLDPMFEPINDTAYDDDNNNREDINVGEIIRLVKDVYEESAGSDRRAFDENAWCLHVVTPLLKLAILLYGDGRFRQESVQSQGLDPVYLPNIDAGTGKRTVTRQTDFCFSYSYRHPEYAAIYDSLDRFSLEYALNPSLDFGTQGTALFSGIEVKSDSGNRKEAEVQMSIWMAASLRKKATLAWYAHENGTLSRRPDHGTFIEPSITIVGSEYKVYYAYVSDPHATETFTAPSRCAVTVFEGVGLYQCNTVEDIFRLARLFGNMMEYAADENPETGYWGAFMGPLLESLVQGEGDWW